MARVLAISSFLAHGRVGLGATVPVLQAFGHEVVQLPTVILSNHPGHARVAGQAISPEHLAAMLDALKGNGWLEGIGAVVTGYLPSPGHVGFASSAAEEIRRINPAAIYVCDPILGDDPKGLYIDPQAAAAIRDLLVPRADLITPNRFELSWLTAREVSNPGDCQSAAETLACRAVLATSIPAGTAPAGTKLLANVLVADGESLSLTTPRRQGVPHGTGDVLTALISGHLVSGPNPLRAAFERSHDQLERIVAQSVDREHLQLSPLTCVKNLP